MRHPSSLFSALFAALLIGAAPFSCTVFDGLIADAGYLDVLQASRLCARILACPTLGPSIRASLSVPADDASFSACMSWFAGPVSAPPETIVAVRPALAAMAAASSCEEALSLAGSEVIADGDPRCASGEDLCLGTGAGAAVDCDGKTVTRCDGALLDSGSACSLDSLSKPGLDPEPRARCRVAECKIPDSPACDADGVVEVCDFRANARERFRCDAIGLECVKVTIGIDNGAKMVDAAICATPGVSSTSCEEQPSAGASCSIDGKTITLCSRHADVKNAKMEDLSFSLIQAVYTCPEGWGCEGASEVAAHAHCQKVGGCTLADARAHRCDGSSLPVCLSGSLRTVDCAEGGMECREDARGAFCAFPGG